MAFEPKDMTGVLFKNEKKKSEKSPDYTGNVLIHGQKFNIMAWVKTAKSDKKYFSIAVIDEMDQTSDPESEYAPSEKTTDKPNDDIPF